MLIEGGEQRSFACMLAHDLDQVNQVLLPENLHHARVSFRSHVVFGEKFAAEFDQACVCFLQARRGFVIPDHIDDGRF